MPAASVSVFAVQVAEHTYDAAEIYAEKQEIPEVHILSKLEHPNISRLLTSYCKAYLVGCCVLL